MYGILIGVHNIVAWAVLATGILVLVKAATRQQTWNAGDTAWVRRLTLFAHLQLLAGLGLWFTSPTVAQARQSMGDSMKDPHLRRLLVEHPTLMLAAVIAATVSGVLVKKAPNAPAKAKKALVGTIVTMLLVAAVLPWARLVTVWTNPS